LLDAAYYPAWSPFSEEDLTEIPDLGAKIKQVMWAAGEDPTMAGVQVYDNCLAATNRYRLAKIDVNTGMPTEKRFLIPARILSRVIPDQGIVKIGMPGARLHLMPNDYTQIQTVVIESGLLDIRRPLKRSFTETTTFNKVEFMQMLSRAMDFTGGNRQSTLTVYVGDSQIALYMDNTELGLIGDIVDAYGSAEQHALIEIRFNPINLRDAVASFPGDTVTMKYDLQVKEAQKTAVSFTNSADYTSIVAPLSAPPSAPETPA
jgi:DNA polymerase III sliding clamp (beta) subunit (PCNA family)